MPAESTIRSRIGRPYAIGLYLLSALFLALSFWHTYTRYYGHARIAVVETGAPPLSDTVEPARPVNLTAVAALQLFGAPEREVTVPVVVAPQTRLRLRLLGIVATDAENRSRALVQVERGAVVVLAVGDELPGGIATVHAIEQGRILLRRGGALESLELERPQLDGQTGNEPDLPVEQKLMLLPEETEALPPGEER